MAEFSGIPPSGINSIVRPAPVAPPPAVPGVEAGLKGGGLSGQMTSDARQPIQARARTPEPTKPETGKMEIKSGSPDPRQIAGPSPSFQASVLELELDLQNTIARVEAARGKRESDIAGVTIAATKGPSKEAGEASADMDQIAAKPPETERPKDAPDSDALRDATGARSEDPATDRRPEPAALPSETD